MPGNGDGIERASVDDAVEEKNYSILATIGTLRDCLGVAVFLHFVGWVYSPSVRVLTAPTDGGCEYTHPTTSLAHCQIASPGDTIVIYYLFLGSQ